MLREDPTLINTLDYPLPGRNMEEMNFILKTIFESLDSNKPLNSSMIYKTPYISPILYKNMTYVSNLSKDVLQDMAPEIEHFFAIRHIPYSEDIPEVLRSFYRPEFRETGYPEGYIAPSLSERKFTVLPPELSDLDQESSYEFLRQNPQYLRVTGLARTIREKGYVIRDDDPIAFKLNRSLVTSTILHDPSYIYKLDPIATGISRDSRSIAEILIHQPLIGGHGITGQTTDIKIHAENMIKTRERLNKILSDRTGKPLEQIMQDTERDHYMTAEEALEYGLIDEILTKRK
jgi:hypothetical protein